MFAASESSATTTEVIDKNEFFAMMCPPGYKMETSEDKEGKMPLALGSANMLQPDVHLSPVSPVYALCCRSRSNLTTHFFSLA